MSSKIPTVHRRNVGGEQWFQRLRVVPVVEVAPVPFQSFHCVECIRRAFDELSCRNVAKVVSGQICEQGKSHVSRRRAMCDPGNGMLLIVIRRQPMIFRACERFEERPGLSGNLTEKAGLFVRQLCYTASERPADPPDDGRGGKPDAKYLAGHCQNRWSRNQEKDHCGSGNNRG